LRWRSDGAGGSGFPPLRKDASEARDPRRLFRVRLKRVPFPVMSLEEVAGVSYGPFAVGISAEKVAEYVMATSDSVDRWHRYAPPGYASALLFVVAPRFLEDPRVKPFTGVLVHVDQAFTWHGPLPVGDQVRVEGRVERVRERGGSFFVTFAASVDTMAGKRLIDAVATFLMGAGSAVAEGAEHHEPVVWKRELNEHPHAVPRPGAGESLPVLAKSASRIDLVKYAAASGDYNPIHFDHDAARRAGLDGIVVHGLLMAAWAMQVAGSVSARPDALGRIKLRFRSALRPGEPARVAGIVRELDSADGRVDVEVTSGDEKLVTAECLVRWDG
jgi:acyl dehydratase